MSTVDAAVEAGAESMVKFLPSRLGLVTLAFRVGLVNAWPALSAGLRELHTRWDQGGGWVACMHCNDNTDPPRKRRWPCEAITELDRIDRELGIGADHQSGDRDA